MGSDRSSRHYSEPEVARILKQAAEIQAARDPGVHDPEGLTHEDLLRIGHEVGLSPGAIEAALDEMEDEPGRAQEKILGAPPSYQLVRLVGGHLTDADWLEVVGKLNETFNQSIEGVTSGSVRTWKWKHDLGYIQLTASEMAGETKLRLTAYLDDAITVGLIPTIVAVLMLAGGFWSAEALRPWYSALLTVVAILLPWWWFRSICSSWLKRDRRKLNRLMDTIQSSLKNRGFDQRLLQSNSSLGQNNESLGQNNESLG